MAVLMNLLVAFTNGGPYVLMHSNLFPASGRTLNQEAACHFVAFSLRSASVGW
jgi:hypothetical protein